MPLVGAWFYSSILCRICHWIVDETLAMSGLRRRSYRPAARILPRSSLSKKHPDHKPYGKTLWKTLRKNHFPSGTAALAENVSPYLQADSKLEQSDGHSSGPYTVRSVLSDKTANLFCKLAAILRTLPGFCADRTAAAL